MEEIFKRVSVRKYTDQIVEEKKIEKILRAAMASPSAKNGQPWEFYVIRNKEKLQELSESTPYSMCVKNAPLAIVICYRKELIAPEFREIDCAIATENILLEAVHQNLGGVMIGISPNEEKMKSVERVLNIPDYLRTFTIIPIGYPEHEKTQEDRFDRSRIHFVD